jgi:hypothetical protein
MQRQRKGAIGSFLGSLVQTVSSGIPIVGGKLGDLVASQARRLPFKKGGVVMSPIIAQAKKMKGSEQMKEKMKRLRAMRGKGKK